MAEVVLCAVEPVAGWSKVCDISCLSSTTVVSDNTNCSCRNVDNELSFAVIVYYCLSLSRTRPFAAERIAVSVPCVNVCMTPTEVVGKVEG